MVSLPPTLDAHVELGAQPCRAVVPRGHRQGDPTPRLSLSARVHERDRDNLKAHNDDPKLFVWSASAENILEKVRRGRVALEAITN
jgi:hypothetical protein